MNYNPADPFGSPPIHQTADDPARVQDSPPNDGHVWRALGGNPMEWEWGRPTELHIVPWPRDELIPVDPWCQFVDDQTGEPFDYTPGQLPRVSSR